MYAIAQRWLGGSACVCAMYVCMSVAVRASCRALGYQLNRDTVTSPSKLIAQRAARRHYIYTLDQKRQTTNSWPQLCQILTDFQNFAVEGSLTNLYSSGLIKIAYVATLLCETLLSENKRLMINYEALRLHILGVVTKCLLLSLPVTLFKSASTWQSY